MDMVKRVITRDTTLGEIVSKWPQAAALLTERGLHCVGCHIAAWESIAAGAAAHGMSDKEIDRLIAELNRVIREQRA